MRYPELDCVQDGELAFGNYLFGTQSTHGGFLPVFWNAPTAYMHAATDIGCVVEWVQSQFHLTADENGCLAQSQPYGYDIWQLRMGHTGCWEGSIQERHILCRHDGTSGPACADSSRIS